MPNLISRIALSVIGFETQNICGMIINNRLYQVRRRIHRIVWKLSLFYTSVTPVKFCGLIPFDHFIKFQRAPPYGPEPFGNKLKAELLMAEGRSLR